MGPHWGRAEGEQNLLRPSAHTPPNAPQDPVSFLGSQGTLLAHGQPKAISPQGLAITLSNLLNRGLSLCSLLVLLQKIGLPFVCSRVVRWSSAYL